MSKYSKNLTTLKAHIYEKVSYRIIRGELGITRWNPSPDISISFLKFLNKNKTYHFYKKKKRKKKSKLELNVAGFYSKVNAAYFSHELSI